MEELFTALFSLLAAGFRYPEDEDMLKRIKEMAGLIAERCEDGRLRGLLKELERKEVKLRELQYEYTSLFINRFPETPCHPYESVNRGLGGRVMDKYAIDVLETYLKNGFVVKGKELPDHISIELEFVARVSKEVRRKFIRRHLALWVYRFLECIERNDEGGFYTLLSKIMKKTLDLYSKENPIF